MIYHLGKGPAVIDPLGRDLKMAAYLPTLLPPIPASVEWRGKFGKMSMWGNDLYGICVWAAFANMIQLWCSQSGKPFTLTREDVLAAYSGCTGFDPNDPSTDRGTVILDALKWMQKEGMGGYKIGPYMDVNPHNTQHVRAATYLFGTTAIGIQLPLSAQGQFDAGHSWTMAGAAEFGDTTPGSWGGHGVMNGACLDNLPIGTWSQWQPTMQDFMEACCDEMKVVLSPDWMNNVGENPLGFNYAQLLADMRAVQG